MKLKDLIYSLILGELSDTVIGSEYGLGTDIITGKPTIKQLSSRNLYKLIEYTNQGLLDIYSSRRLLEKFLIIEEQANITTYFLERKFTESAEAELPENIHPYIKDSKINPFTDDVLKILRVYTANGDLLPLNDKYKPFSVFTPLPNAILINHPEDGIVLKIHYQANHKRLDNINIQNTNNASYKDNEALLEQVLDIPLYIFNALRYFIANKYFMHTNSPKDMNQANLYLQLYHNELKAIMRYDFNNIRSVDSQHKFKINKWV